MKFYTVHDTDGTAKWLTSVGFTEVTPSEADIIIFNGGADIGSSIYGEKPAWPGVPYATSSRDEDEVDLYREHVGKVMFVGICRGAQLLNCLNGGTLWQHVDNHGYHHKIFDIRSGSTYVDASEHHQMMRPNLKTGEILAVSNQSTLKVADGLRYTDIERPQKISDGADVEVVWYPGTRTLCLQGHPEWTPNTPYAEYCLGLIKEFAS